MVYSEETQKVYINRSVFILENQPHDALSTLQLITCSHTPDGVVYGVVSPSQRNFIRNFFSEYISQFF